MTHRPSVPPSLPRTLVAALLLVGPVVARAQAADPAAAAPAAPPAAAPTPAPAPREGFFSRLARGIDQVNAAATGVRMQKAVSIDLTARGLAPVAYGGAQLGVSAIDVRPGAGVRLHLFLHNTGDQPLSVPAPQAGQFALLDAQGRTLATIGQLVAVTGNGYRAPEVSGGTLTVPALERVSYALLFAAPRPDATELILRVAGMGVIRGIPAHADGATAAATAPDANQAPTGPAVGQPGVQQPQPATQQPPGVPAPTVIPPVR